MVLGGIEGLTKLRRLNRAIGKVDGRKSKSEGDEYEESVVLEVQKIFSGNLTIPKLPEVRA